MNAPVTKFSGCGPTPLAKGEKLWRFQDGEETISVRIRELPGRQYIAVDNECPDVAGFGLTELSACADLFRKLPQAASEREERDDMAARWDHQRRLRAEA